MAADGVVKLQSHHQPKETVQRLEEAIKARGMTVFAHIDHAAAAADVGLTLRPTNLLIFGNPKGGTLLMQSAQEMGIDLPLKALVWQDDRGTTWLSYIDPAWLAQRYGGTPGAEAAVRATAGAIGAIARGATSESSAK